LLSCLTLYVFLLTSINTIPVFSAAPPDKSQPQAIQAKAIKVSGGGNHSCAVSDTGAVLCWGNNGSGQLGDGTRIHRTSPTQVVGLTSGAAQVATGHTFSCALVNGGVKCWGFGFYGQLGNGGSSSNNPVDVTGLTSGVIAIATGDNHACALTSSNGVKCWGLNTDGQLGNSNNSNQSAPVDVSGLTNGVSGIGLGANHSCARLIAGGAKCWGDNSGGQLGNGNTSDSNVPQSVNTLSGTLSALDGGQEHTCAQTSTGGMFCWGKNNNGRLGDGTFTDKTSPVQVSGMASGVSTIGTGGEHSCATVNNVLKCWGNNSNGQLGDGTTGGHASPTDVSGAGGGATTVSGGSDHTCAVLPDGSLKCWGFNLYGQLGNSESGIYLSPVTVSGFSSGASQISSGDSHTCALTSGGGLKCWGGNYVGQLGTGNNTSSNLPVDVFGLTSGVSLVSAGTNHTCAVTSAGGVKCWGYNQSGQLGDASNTHKNFPVDVSGLSSGMSKVSAGGDHSCAVTNSGGVKCWGLNGDGQLGNGNNNNSNVPVDVSGLATPVSQVATGSLHTCVLNTSGGVLCWGDNATGQLGNGNNNDSNTPVAVSGLSSGVIAMTAGGDHSCAVLNSGTVKCWGKNYSGQLGNGSSGGSFSTPGDVTGIASGATAVDAGSVHTCALVSGGVKCWGSNTDGALGDGTGISNSSPVNVSGLSSGALAVSAGGGHACAIVSPSEIKCWGSSDDGEIGNGIPIRQLLPVGVTGFAGNPLVFLPMLAK
jgi:alpha-tubulin suppressor-like RCC1 family protein